MHNFEARPLSIFGYSHHDALIISSKILEVGWIVHKNNDKVLLICIIFWELFLQLLLGYPRNAQESYCLRPQVSMAIILLSAA